jgi:hypothetical protein
MNNMNRQRLQGNYYTCKTDPQGTQPLVEQSLRKVQHKLEHREANIQQHNTAIHNNKNMQTKTQSHHPKHNR